MESKEANLLEEDFFSEAGISNESSEKSGSLLVHSVSANLIVDADSSSDQGVVPLFSCKQTRLAVSSCLSTSNVLDSFGRLNMEELKLLQPKSYNEPRAPVKLTAPVVVATSLYVPSYAPQHSPEQVTRVVLPDVVELTGTALPDKVGPTRTALPDGGEGNGGRMDKSLGAPQPSRSYKPHVKRSSWYRIILDSKAAHALSPAYARSISAQPVEEKNGRTKRWQPNPEQGAGPGHLSTIAPVFKVVEASTKEMELEMILEAGLPHREIPGKEQCLVIYPATHEEDGA
eukprot:gene24969-10629_t